MRYSLANLSRLLEIKPYKKVGFSIESLLTHMLILGASGHGKSFYILGLCLWLYEHGIPFVLLDVVGVTAYRVVAAINDYLWYLVLTEQISRAEADRRWRNGRLLELGEQQHIQALPWLAEYIPGLPTDARADQVIATIRMADPSLSANAPINGIAAIQLAGKPLLMTLIKLGLEVTEAPLLLRNRERLKPLLTDLAARSDDLGLKDQVVYLLNDFPKLGKMVQEQRMSSLKAKLSMLSSNAALAFWGAEEPAWRLQDIDEPWGFACISGKKVTNSEQLRLQLAHIVHQVRAYAKTRSATNSTFAFIVDETSSLFTDTKTQAELVGQMISEMLRVYGRNHKVINIYATQSLKNYPKEVTDTLLSCGMHVIGAVEDYHTAELLATQHFPYKPLLVKDYNFSYISSLYPPYSYTPVTTSYQFYTADEQHTLAAYMLLRQLPPLHFYTRIPRWQGDRTAPLQKVSIERMVNRLRLDEARMAMLGQHLIERDGTPVEEIIEAIMKRRQQVLGIKAPPSKPQTALKRRKNPIKLPAGVVAEDAQRVFDATLDEVLIRPHEQWRLP